MKENPPEDTPEEIEYAKEQWNAIISLGLELESNKLRRVLIISAAATVGIGTTICCLSQIALNN